MMDDGAAMASFVAACWLSSFMQASGKHVEVSERTDLWKDVTFQYENDRFWQHLLEARISDDSINTHEDMLGFRFS